MSQTGNALHILRAPGADKMGTEGPTPRRKRSSAFQLRAPWTAEHVPWTRGLPLQESERPGQWGAQFAGRQNHTKTNSFSLFFLGFGAVLEAGAAGGPGTERHPRGGHTARTPLASS